MPHESLLCSWLMVWVVQPDSRRNVLHTLPCCFVVTLLEDGRAYLQCWLIRGDSIPRPETMWTNTLTCGTEKEHLGNFKDNPLSSRVCRSCSKGLACSSMSLDHSQMLSDTFWQLGTSLMIWWIISWKYSPETHAPMIRRLNLICGPSSGVENAVMWRDSSAKVICR